MKNTRREQIRRVKQYEKQRKLLRDSIGMEYIEDGRAVVTVLLQESTLYEPLSYGNQKELSRDIYDYIDSKIYYIPVRYPITIRFLKSHLQPGEEKEISEYIKEHYTLILQDKRLDLKINTWKTVVLAILGFLLLGLYFFLEIINQRPLFTEFLSIAGTFSLWEAVDFYLLERKQIQAEWLDAGQSALCEVEFINQNENNKGKGYI